MSNTKDSKILSLESLRGIAAITVACSHFKTGAHFNNRFTDSAWLMVDLFFVLSGFVIALNYQDKLSSWGDLYRFQVKRFFRLYPLHLLMLFVFLGLEIAKYVVQQAFGLTANNQAFSDNNLYTFISNLFLAHNLFDAHLSWNRPSWSISAEFYTYISFALLILAVGNKRASVIVAAFFISAATFYLLIDLGMESSSKSGPTRCAYSFFLGVICYNLYALVKGKIKIIHLFPYVLLVLSVLAVLFNKGYKDTSSLFIPILFMFTILSLVLSPAKSGANRLLGQRYLVYLGTISYGIYMIHFAVWWVLNQVARFVFAFPTKTDLMGRSVVVFEHVLVADAVMLFGLSLIIYLAHLSYKQIEMPMNNLCRRISR